MFIWISGGLFKKKKDMARQHSRLNDKKMFKVPAFFMLTLKISYNIFSKQFLVTVICGLPKHMPTLLGSVQIQVLKDPRGR